MDKEEEAREERAQWTIEKLRNPSTFERFEKSITLFLTSKSEIDKMRNQLIQEFRSPFIAYLGAKSNDERSNQITVSYFEKRINTLPKNVVSYLYDDYLKMKQMKTEDGKNAVEKSILNTIELSYSLNGWFARELVKEKW